MSIAVLILKIIGILLFVILILAALLLFYPVSYRLSGACEEEWSARAAFWWLFRILRLELFIESGEMKSKVFVFGFCRRKRADRQEAAGPKDGASETDGPVSEYAEDDGRGADSSEVCRQIGENSKEERAKDDKAEDGGSEAPRRIDDAPESKGSRRSRKKPAAREKKRGVWQEVTDSGNREAVLHVWQEILCLLSYVKPQKAEGEISYSAGDPALTGEITGALSLLPFLYRYDAHAYPDFLSDKCYVRGRLTLQGRVAAFYFVRSFFRLFRDKDAVRLYRKIMQRQ